MSSDNNLSAVLLEKLNINLEERPIPKPGDDEVQISMHSVGICGSDIHYWLDGRIGDTFVLKKPMVLGHESSGIVTALGNNVTNLNIGDRVAIEPGVPCRKCNYCKSGKYNLCLDVIFHSTPPIHGTLTRYIVHPADFCFKLPDNVSLEEGALCEPLSVGIHACRRAGVSLSHKVLICGAGPIGLVSLLCAKAMGAAEVCMTDISKERLEFAKQMGADEVVLVDTKDSLVIAERVEAALKQKADVSIECSGAESSVQLGIYATRSAGCLVLVGLGPSSVNIPICSAACREVDIRGIFRYVNTYPTAINMISSGAVNVKPLITHHFPLEETVAAFETAKTGAGGAIKVVIDCFKK